MSYFLMEDGELVLVKTEKLPSELEELYQKIRKTYIIQSGISDWAEDTGDSGMGYEYNNSYELSREPERREMVIQNGGLAGFYVGFSNNMMLESEATKEYFLKLESGAELYKGSSSSRYGRSKAWKLHIKDRPAPLEHVCLMWVNNEDADHTFTPEEFGCDLVESVKSMCKWEDNYGRFDGAFRVTLKLTKQGSEKPDEALRMLQAYKPVLVNAEMCDKD